MESREINLRATRPGRQGEQLKSAQRKSIWRYAMPPHEEANHKERLAREETRIQTELAELEARQTLN